jgi:hypothetical protein
MVPLAIKMIGRGVLADEVKVRCRGSSGGSELQIIPFGHDSLSPTVAMGNLAIGITTKCHILVLTTTIIDV